MTDKSELAKQADESKKSQDAHSVGDVASPNSEKSSEVPGKKKGKAKEKEGGDKPGILSTDQAQKLLSMNLSLQNEVASMKPTKMQDLINNMSLTDAVTGIGQKGSQKDMASYKFWQTQPVPSFSEAQAITEDGPVKDVKIEDVPKDPRPLYPGFEWVVMDLNDEGELKEVYELLSGHYVEDHEAMFRFNYSPSFLSWALKAPGWRKDWHIGVRATQSRKLVAFISAIPLELRVRKNILNASEVNFLVVHKKLRDKRLAPVLIGEITRCCNLVGVYQAIYTAGVVLPTPISTCRYFHRSLNWEKLYDVGFSPLPQGSTKQRQVLKFKLPTSTSTHGLRLMVKKDIPAVLDLLKRYLERFQIAQVFTEEEVTHWLLHSSTLSPEQVVWSYVVESPEKKITDFISFYRLESTALKSAKHTVVRAAYLFYYATETAFGSTSNQQGSHHSHRQDNTLLKKRLNELVKDAMILAKKEGFDVFNALTLLDNPLFLEEQKFGAGDGHLHYYLYNYRCTSIPGGINEKKAADEREMGGVGVVML